MADAPIAAVSAICSTPSDRRRHYISCRRSQRDKPPPAIPELHRVSVDTTLSDQEPRGAEGWTKKSKGRMWLLGLWAAPRCPARDKGAVGALAPGQRWSLSRKRDVVLRLMQGEPVEGLSRRLGLPVYKLEEWRQRGLAGIDAALRGRDDAPQERALAEAHRRIGALSMESELLRARLEKPGPLAHRRSR